MGFTVFLIIFFGIAAIIPAVWAIVGVIRGNTSFWPCVAGAIFAVALLLVTIIGSAKNWGDCPVEPGTTSKDAVKCFKGDKESDCKPDVLKVECKQTLSTACANIPAGKYCPKDQTEVFPFCEPFDFGSGVKQPWSTWSDLSFVAAGLWILWFFQYFGRFGHGKFTQYFSSGANPMVVIGPLSITYGFIVIFMGPPSQWFHASIQEWAGWFDTMSVVIWLLFNAVYVLFLLIFAMWDKGRGLTFTAAVLGFWVILVVSFGFIAEDPERRLYLYLAAGIAWGAFEVIYASIVGLDDSVKYYRNWRWFIANLVLLAVTMGLWMLYNDGIVGKLCQDLAVFPGHATFHILASFSTILTFLSFGSEKSK